MEVDKAQKKSNKTGKKPKEHKKVQQNEKSSAKSEATNKKSHSKKNKKRIIYDKSHKKKGFNLKKEEDDDDGGFKDALNFKILSDVEEESPEIKLTNEKKTDYFKSEIIEKRSNLQSPSPGKTISDEESEIILKAPTASPEHTTPEKVLPTRHLFTKIKGSKSLDFSRFKENIVRKPKLNASVENISESESKSATLPGKKHTSKESSNIKFFDRMLIKNKDKEGKDFMIKEGEECCVSPNKESKKKIKNKEDGKANTSTKGNQNRFISEKLRRAFSVSAMLPSRTHQYEVKEPVEPIRLDEMPQSCPVSPMEARMLEKRPSRTLDMPFTPDNRPPTPVLGEKSTNARYLETGRRGSIAKETIMIYPKGFQRIKERFSKRFLRKIKRVSKSIFLLYKIYFCKKQEAFCSRTCG